MRLGFVGLGAIGAPMAGRIVASGQQLGVWNRSAGKLAGLVGRGAVATPTPAALAECCDILCLCVTDATALDAVVFGRDGIAAARHAPAYVVDHSTVPPEDTRRLAARLAEATGTIWVDAPVSGGIIGAEQGTLAAFVGGPSDAFAAVRGVLGHYCGTVTHMGPTGSGQATKACNQMIGFLSAVAVAEALVLAERLGVQIDRLPDALSGGFADVPALREWRRNMAQLPLIGLPLHIEALRAFLSGDRPAPPYDGASPANLRKDIGIIRDLARETGTALPLTEQMALTIALLHASRGA